MGIKKMSVKIKGIAPLLQNNPQTVDPFNKYAKRMAEINKQKTYKKTEEGILEMREIEMRSKIYFDAELGIYIPARWINEALAKDSNAIIKSSKEKIRGSVFLIDEKIKLHYDGENLVKTEDDIVKNPKFQRLLILKQGQQTRLAKAAPIFHNWSFELDFEYDDKIHDFKQLQLLILHVSKYSGFGDFRPTYGRALAEVTQ